MVLRSLAPVTVRIRTVAMTALLPSMTILLEKPTAPSSLTITADSNQPPFVLTFSRRSLFVLS